MKPMKLPNAAILTPTIALIPLRLSQKEAKYRASCTAGVKIAVPEPGKDKSVIMSCGGFANSDMNGGPFLFGPNDDKKKQTPELEKALRDAFFIAIEGAGQGDRCLRPELPESVWSFPAARPGQRKGHHDIHRLFQRRIKP